jgi:hypothetical protein
MPDARSCANTSDGLVASRAGGVMACEPKEKLTLASVHVRVEHTKQRLVVCGLHEISHG